MIRKRLPTRALVVVAAASISIAAGLLSQPSALAVRGVNLGLTGNQIGADEVITVWVGTSPHRRCRGSVRLGELRAPLPSLKTDRTGGGRWRWKVGDDVPAGTWHVRVKCRLPSETVLATLAFHAPAGPQTGKGVRGLIAPGSMSAKPAHKKTASTGVIGISESSGFAEHRGSPSAPSSPLPEVELQAPAEGETVSGEVTVAASGSGPAVRFEAFYSQTPQVPGTARWQVLGSDVTPGDGFAISWDTTEVPNQGLPSQQTVRVRVTGLGPREAIGEGSTRRVSVSNPGADGSYRYHVFGTCAEGGGCETGLHAGPGSSYPSLGSRAEGDEVDVVCQAMGEAPDTAPSDDVWDMLADASWIADHYVDTPATGTFSPPIPACE